MRAPEIQRYLIPRARWQWLGYISLTLALLLSTLQCPAPVAAQSPAEENDAMSSPEYRELVRKALQEYSVGHYTEARVFFTQAHQMAPNARTLRGLAMVCYESRHYAEAIAYAEQALAHQVAPVTAQRREELEQILAQSRAFVARAHIVSTPEKPELRVDGQTVVPTAEGVVLLDPGDHELTAIAPGYEVYTQSLRVDGGGDVRYDIAMTPRQTAAPVASLPATDRTSEAKDGSILPWVVVGASAAFVVAGGVMLAVGESARSKVEGLPNGANWPDYKGAYSRAPVFLDTGWVFLGLGLAGAAAGLTWKFYLEPKAEHPAKTASLHISPGSVMVSAMF